MHQATEKAAIIAVGAILEKLNVEVAFECSFIGGVVGSFSFCAVIISFVDFFVYIGFVS